MATSFNEQILGGKNLPSIFELLAQESMSQALRPAIQYVTKVVLSTCPAVVSRPLISHTDEIWVVIEGTLQGIFLWKYNGSVSENFYDLIRYYTSSRGTKWKSLIVMILVPYILLKLEKLFIYLLEENDLSPLHSDSSEDINLKQLLKYHLYKWIPHLLRTWKIFKFIFQLLYLCHKSEYYSPELWLSGVQLMRKIETAEDTATAEFISTTSSGTTLLMKLTVQYIVPLFLFLLKFIEWWYSNEREDTVKKISSLPNPPPPPPLNNTSSTHSSLCPLCHKTRRNPTTLSCSGFVFCYVCILNYVKRYGVCPMTSLSADENKLIRIFIQH